MVKINLRWIASASLFLSLGLFSAPSARADEAYTFIIKKQEKKAQSRWSLSDWLETREKMRWMDLWLSMHTPSPFEFYMGSDYTAGSVDTGGAAGGYTGFNYRVVGFASAFGLELSREARVSGPARWNAAFDWRIFGNQMQGTHLTLQLGIKQDSLQQFANATYRNPFYGFWMSIYLAKFFGLDGFYRQYMDSTPNTSGLKYNGRRYEAGAFIDFKFLRLFGTYFNELQRGSPVSTRLDGALFGAKIFF